ncbi:MAG: type II secretion system protein [Telluria sp.]
MFAPKSRSRSGFTLIELIVVLTIVSLMLSIVVPRYFHSIDKAKESMLRQNLSSMRETIDKFYGDLGRYPDSLDEMVQRKYIRAIPIDPLTESTTTWRLVESENQDLGVIYDIHSGSDALALDGSLYSEW